MVIKALQDKKYEEAYALMSQKTGKIDFSLEYDNDRTVRSQQVGTVRAGTDKNSNRKTKIAIPFQRNIVNTASVFLLGQPLSYSPNESKHDGYSHKAVTKAWRATRMDSLLLKFAKTVKSQTEAAIIFFNVKDGSGFKVKAKLIDSDSGKMLTYFDEFENLVAFGWDFEVSVSESKVRRMHLYTADHHYQLENAKGEGWKEYKPKVTNLFGKIPVMYMSQKHPEWWEVQDLIDRFENTISKFCDSNDYFAFPYFKAKGVVDIQPNKDGDGGTINLEGKVMPDGQTIYADVEMLVWDQAPEAIKLELDTINGLINSLSSTPDITINALKGVGSIAAASVKLLFLAPILKAKQSEGDYRVAVSRVLNIIQAGLRIKDSSLIDYDIAFNSVLPENLKETVDVLSEATGGKSIMSQRKAVQLNPMITDFDGEIEQMKSERAAIDILGETVVL